MLLLFVEDGHESREFLSKSIQQFSRYARTMKTDNTHDTSGPGDGCCFTFNFGSIPLGSLVAISKKHAENGRTDARTLARTQTKIKVLRFRSRTKKFGREGSLEGWQFSFGSSDKALDYVSVSLPSGLSESVSRD
jgi:hypothetical protein